MEVGRYQIKLPEYDEPGLAGSSLKPWWAAVVPPLILIHSPDKGFRSGVQPNVILLVSKYGMGAAPNIPVTRYHFS